MRSSATLTPCTVVPCGTLRRIRQAADGWAPPVGEGEAAWRINALVGHVAGSRLYFASAYRGEGWISRTPGAWLTRKVGMIDSEGMLSGW
jgi:hypothetical protein